MAAPSRPAPAGGPDASRSTVAARHTHPRRAPVRAAAAALVGTGAIALADPTTNHVPLCPMLAVTGLDCPLCGGLRAVQDLARGDIAAAADHNVLLVASLPLVVAAWVWWFRRAGDDDPRPIAPPRWATLAVAVLLVAFTVVRNLPVAPWLDSA